MTEAIILKLLALVTPKCAMCGEPATRQATRALLLESEYFCDTHDHTHLASSWSKLIPTYQELAHAKTIRDAQMLLKNPEVTAVWSSWQDTPPPPGSQG